MAAELITLPQLTIRRIAVSSMDNNVYLLTHRGDGSQLLIDAAADPAAIQALLATSAGDAPTPVRLRYLLTTHAHADHLGALAELVDSQPGVVTLAGEADADAITAATGVPIARRLHHGDRIELGQTQSDIGAVLDVIGLRGHTPGSVALSYADPDVTGQLFTGDSLFPGGVGNTGQDPARFASLFGDVVARIFEVYPDDTVIWPGHGRPTTVGAERPQLPQWHARGW